MACKICFAASAVDQFQGVQRVGDQAPIESNDYKVRGPKWLHEAVLMRWSQGNRVPPSPRSPKEEKMSRVLLKVRMLLQRARNNREYTKSQVDEVTKVGRVRKLNHLGQRLGRFENT